MVSNRTRIVTIKLALYKWNPLYALIHALSGIGQFAVIVFLFIEPMHKKIHIEQFIIILMNLSVYIVGAYMILFCRRWSIVLFQVEDIERTLPPVSAKHLKRMKILVILAIITEIADLLLHMTKNVLTALACSDNDSNDFFQKYFESLNISMLNYEPLKYFTLIMQKILLIQQRMMWHFTDILVITISLYLNIRFAEFNRFLKEMEKELTYGDKRDLPWAKVQQRYTKLMKLTKILAKYISPLVFFSFSNVIMIGRQVYLILHSHVLPEECEYYGPKYFTLFRDLFAGAHIVSRVAMVSGFAAQVHTLSRKPLEALYTIPSFSYNITFQRFVDQVYHSNISLNGFRCFYVTRQMILSMLASLLTFELMLLDANNGSGD